MLDRRIDNHEETANIDLLKECIVDLLINEREHYYHKFLDSTGGKSAETVDKSFAVKMQQEIKKLNNEKIQLIDVRESYEREICHIGGKHIPLSLFEAHIEKLDKVVPIMVYCKSGRRSATACQMLVDAGFEHVNNLEGGILEWIDTIDNQLIRY